MSSLQLIRTSLVPKLRWFCVMDGFGQLVGACFFNVLLHQKAELVLHIIHLVCSEYFFFKSCIQETLTLSACADKRTNTKKSGLFDTFLRFWSLFSLFFKSFFGTFCCEQNQVSHVMSHISCLTCDM